MKSAGIDNENTVFVVLSFEGPDIYSLAGGLGVRVTNLSQTLAHQGFTTHFFFIGDPREKGEEVRERGKLIHHRWCQWISEYHPAGVYQGENEKLCDFNASIPPFIMEHIVGPALKQDKMVAILAEEWQTAEVMCRIGDLLDRHGMRDRVATFWNANNTFGFERVDWARLNETATLTTVSRYMKHIMWGMGMNPLVIPNGIPRSLLSRPNSAAAHTLRKNVGDGVMLTKVARWDPDKRWNMAVEAVARIKARGTRTVLLARGGIEAYGQEVLYNARSLGLSVRDACTKGNTTEDYLQAVADCNGADVINIRFYCPPEFLQVAYHASDAVLANSGREPFGLVGLETMAAGGVAFTGNTGEDYAIPFHNAIVLETSDPREIEAYVMYLDSHDVEETRIRRAGRVTAEQFTWEQVLKNLVQKVEYQFRLQGVISPQEDIMEASPGPVEAPGREAVLTGSFQS